MQYKTQSNMKKLTFLLAFFFLGNLTVFAQSDIEIDKDEMQRELQMMQENMQKMLESMGGSFGFQMDTMMFRNLDKMAMPFFDQLGDGGMMFKMDTMFMMPLEEFGENAPQMDRENWGEGMGDMMQQLQQMMQGFDWSQMEDMMQGFGLEAPLVPAPEQLDENGDPLPQDKQIKKKKKKRKTYSL